MSKLQVETISHTNNTTALTIDSSGRVLTSVKPAFFAYSTAASTLTSADTDSKVNFAAEDFDKTNNFANSEFTAPVSGLYHLNVCVNFYSTNISSRYVRARLYKNGSTTNIESHTHSSDETSSQDYCAVSFGCTLDLSANDVMSVYAASNVTNIIVAGFYKTTFFSGHLIG